jgi:hypothetical protein
MGTILSCKGLGKEPYARHSNGKRKRAQICRMMASAEVNPIERLAYLATMEDAAVMAVGMVTCELSC